MSETTGGSAMIFGAGPGLGLALARCLAGAGMPVGLFARSDARLGAMAEDLRGSGVPVHGYSCDVTREEQVEESFRRACRDLGAPSLVVYNAGAYAPAPVLEIDAADFDRCWRVGCLGGFLVGRCAGRAMVEQGFGTIIFTGATASLRGAAGFANLAVGKAGLRVLAQSMARELGPRGVHVAHVVIDGLIGPPGSGDDSRLAPDAIAGEYLRLHRQPRSAWTFELDLRPWVERF
jgi:NAD(P)-dependent dehydrogenase (short-subunit alcohol dehydrogenase family)